MICLMPKDLKNWNFFMASIKTRAPSLSYIWGILEKQKQNKKKNK